MLCITNAQAEPIRIVWDGQCMILDGGCSVSVPNVAKTITFAHCDFWRQSANYAEKVIGTVANASMLVVDCTLLFSEIAENAVAFVRNGAYEYSTGDFGYLYFDVATENCKCSLVSCKAVNRQEVLRAQKLIRMGESYDFPPFSAVGALYRYRKIKKMCSEEKVFAFLSQQQVF